MQTRMQTYFDQLQILMCTRECSPTFLNPHRCFRVNLSAEVLGGKLLVRIGVHEENGTQLEFTNKQLGSLRDHN